MNAMPFMLPPSGSFLNSAARSDCMLAHAFLAKSVASGAQLEFHPYVVCYEPSCNGIVQCV